MKFRNKKNKKEEKKENNEHDIEIVMGDESTLNISAVGDYMNNLRPKGKEEKKKSQIVIPKVNKKK